MEDSGRASLVTFVRMQLASKPLQCTERTKRRKLVDIGAEVLRGQGVRNRPNGFEIEKSLNTVTLTRGYLHTATYTRNGTEDRLYTGAGGRPRAVEGAATPPPLFFPPAKLGLDTPSIRASRSALVQTSTFTNSNTLTHTSPALRYDFDLRRATARSPSFLCV